MKDREAWHASAHGVAKGQPPLSDWKTTSPNEKKLVCYACQPRINMGLRIFQIEDKPLLYISGSHSFLLNAALCLVAQSCLTLFDLKDCSPPGSSIHGDSPGKNTGVSCHAPLQGIFPTQGSNPGLPHCRLILYQLSHKGSPRILEWVAYPFSRGPSQPSNWTGVSCIVGRFFTHWATREAPLRSQNYAI